MPTVVDNASFISLGHSEPLSISWLETHGFTRWMTSGSQVASSSANAFDSGPDWLINTCIHFLAVILFLHELRGVEPISRRRLKRQVASARRRLGSFS